MRSERRTLTWIMSKNGEEEGASRRRLGPWNPQEKPWPKVKTTPLKQIKDGRKQQKSGKRHQNKTRMLRTACSKIVKSLGKSKYRKNGQPVKRPKNSKKMTMGQHRRIGGMLKEAIQEESW